MGLAARQPFRAPVIRTSTDICNAVALFIKSLKIVRAACLGREYRSRVDVLMRGNSVDPGSTGRYAPCYRLTSFDEKSLLGMVDEKCRRLGGYL